MAILAISRWDTRVCRYNIIYLDIIDIIDILDIICNNYIIDNNSMVADLRHNRYNMNRI